MQRLVHVRDLKDQTRSNVPHPILFCEHCGAEDSAHRGDYFALPPEHVFTCCGWPMRLVIKRTVYTAVYARAQCKDVTQSKSTRTR
jgi:hypothetical protein